MMLTGGDCGWQCITLRLQKERDSSAQEAVNLQEKLDLIQSQMSKATRDRELLLSETETSRERYDKLNQSLLKLQVFQVAVDILVSTSIPISLHNYLSSIYDCIYLFRAISGGKSLKTAPKSL